jgi:hypothetical protein
MLWWLKRIKTQLGEGEVKFRGSPRAQWQRIGDKTSFKGDGASL